MPGHHAPYRFGCKRSAGEAQAGETALLPADPQFVFAARDGINDVLAEQIVGYVPLLSPFIQRRPPSMGAYQTRSSGRRRSLRCFPNSGRAESRSQMRCRAGIRCRAPSHPTIPSRSSNSAVTLRVACVYGYSFGVHAKESAGRTHPHIRITILDHGKDRDVA